MISGRSMPRSWPNLRAILIAPSLASRPVLQKKALRQPRQLAQLGRQLLLQRHLVVVGAVDQLGDLVLQRRHQLGVGVAERVDGDAGQRVEVFAALGVPDAAALAVRQRERQAAVGVHHVRGGGRRQLLGDSSSAAPAEAPAVTDSKGGPVLAATCHEGASQVSIMHAACSIPRAQSPLGEVVAAVHPAAHAATVGRPVPAHATMSSARTQFFIQGITRDGKTFRPSDWAERLAGVMSSFRPGGGTAAGRAHRLFAVLRAARDRRREVRDRQRGIARASSPWPGTS